MTNIDHKYWSDPTTLHSFSAIGLRTDASPVVSDPLLILLSLLSPLQASPSQMPFETGAEIFIHYHNPLVISPEYIAI